MLAVRAGRREVGAASSATTSTCGSSSAARSWVAAPLYVAIVTRQVAGGSAHGVSMFLSSPSMKAPFAVTIDDFVVSPASRTAS